MVRYVLLIIIAGIAGGIIARRKGAARCCGFLLCAIVLSCIAIIIFSPLASKGYTKKCPYWIMIIKEDGIVYTHCGWELPIEMVKINNKV